MQHLDSSRPYDWMCNQFMGSMLIKARLMVEFPAGTVPSKTMSPQERMYLLQSSVEIIQLSHRLATDERIIDLLWYFRGYVQWHCMAVVVAELGWNANQSFSNDAWTVVGPMLSSWDAVYKSKQDDPAWDHVNDVIERARSLRIQSRAHAARKNAAGEARTISSVDVLLDRVAPEDTPTRVVHQARSYSTDTSARQSVMTPETQSQAYPGGTWSSHQHQPAQFQPPPLSQYQMGGFQQDGAFTSMGASAGFDTGSGIGFDNIDFDAFNQVFSSQSWNQFDPSEIYTPSQYEPAPFAT